MKVLGPAWTDIASTRAAVIDQILGADLERLGEAGLLGPQLAMKVSAWRLGRARMLAAFEDSEDASASALPLELRGKAPPEGVFAEPTAVPLAQPGLLRRACRWISESLGIGDTVLGSLAGVVSMAEPLKEGKEILERVAGAVGE